MNHNASRHLKIVVEIENFERKVSLKRHFTQCLTFVLDLPPMCDRSNY